MAHPVRFRNSIYLLLVFALSCKNETKQTATIPKLYVAASDKGLQQHKGFLYYNGKKFSGRTYELYPNGDTALLFSYFNGKEEGWCLKWYENKKLMEERLYVAGRKEGEHKGWWPDGTPRFDYNFKDDEHEGEAKEWFNNGKPSRFFRYAKGHEDGLQRMWWEDRRVRANYVVKGGQQYGLIGRKLCLNDDGAKTN